VVASLTCQASLPAYSTSTVALGVVPSGTLLKFTLTGIEDDVGSAVRENAQLRRRHILRPDSDADGDRLGTDEAPAIHLHFDDRRLRAAPGRAWTPWPLTQPQPDTRPVISMRTA